ncbi:RidA family protein [Pelomyxa schiedti]|nr:RidA family protein [Pelomyxa schiedti]
MATTTTQQREVVSTPNAPSAIGPYSQAIKANGMVYCSGAIPLDARTGQMCTGSITEQTNLVLRNIAAILEAAGSSMNKIVSTNVYLSDMNNFAEFNAEYAKHFTGSFPARTTIEAKLPKNAGVEITAIALQ